ncbi:MAG: hypothetical protein VX265_06060 [Myxococcota bacterium]|nr:hypothetical protein [Myxococcota bacterium]MEC8424814.1 hypothetical protein [Myxococcota bacterium]
MSRSLLPALLCCACGKGSAAFPTVSKPTATAIEQVASTPDSSSVPPAGDCGALSGELVAAANERGPGHHLDADGRMQVVVEADPTVRLPAVFVEEARSVGLIQGRVAPEHLCTIASLDGVLRIRPPHRASPK